MHILFGLILALSGMATNKVYFLEDSHALEWCSYSQQGPWNEAVEKTGALNVGALSYSAAGLVQIDLTESGESGDWAVFDHYYLDPSGALVKLDRTTNILPGDRSIAQEYSIRGGRVVKKHTSVTALSTGKPASLAKAAWLPKVPIRSGTSSFPFAALLSRSDIRETERVCVPSETK